MVHTIMAVPLTSFTALVHQQRACVGEVDVVLQDVSEHIEDLGFQIEAQHARRAVEQRMEHAAKLPSATRALLTLVSTVQLAADRGALIGSVHTRQYAIALARHISRQRVHFDPSPRPPVRSLW
jgi:hypothetical protein